MLTESDLQSFARLGIGPELLSRAGVQRVSDAEAREDFGITGHGDRAGIVFPYRDPLTGTRYTARLRRDHPDIEDGKPVKKYLCPYGDRRHLFFVSGCGELVNDTTVPVVIVEAEKSVLALTAWAERMGEKILPVATGGCWGHRARTGKVNGPNGERLDEVGPLPELLKICSPGRRVYVLFDSNASTSRDVQQARYNLMRTIRKQGADGRIINLPAGDGINGPDDFIGGRGDAAMAELFATAETTTRTESTKDDDKRSQATWIVNLVVNSPSIFLFHTRAGEPYAAVTVDGHTGTMPTKSKSFREHVSRMFWHLRQPYRNP